MTGRRRAGPSADAGGTTTDLVAERLRALIVERHLSPGERIRSDQMAAQLGVSRVPVREALQRLAHIGLVELEPRRGARVASVDLSDGGELVELFTVRLQLEPWIAGRAAQRRDDHDLARLRSTIDHGCAAVGNGDLAAVSRAHHDVMAALADAAHSPHASAAFEPLRNRSVLAFAAMAPDVIPDGWPHHVEVVDAVVAGDRARASATARQHLELLIRSVRANAGPFALAGMAAVGPRSRPR